MENSTKKRLNLYHFLIFILFGTGQIFAQCPNIIWQDEFDGTSLDQSKWNYQIGDGCDQNLCGWGNSELQSYQEANVVVSNGTLKITAQKERIRGSQYTSGRINTKGKADFTYGRFEASIKLPRGDGLWPAFWMLSTNEEYGGWPQSGEIDIMEYVASTPDEILGYIHYGDPYPNNQSQGNTYKLMEDVFYNAFHEFAVEWEPGEIRWYMDGILFSTKTPADISPANWPFDKDFHFLLNVAVGGNLGGDVVDSMLPATMEVDYVRVYDGFKAYITGDPVVSHQETGINYSVGNLPSNVNVTWTVPNGATIVTGQGSNSIIVDFGSESGTVSASFNTGCSTQVLNFPVEVEAPYVKGFSFENFDEPATVTLANTTGTLNEVSNPAANPVNSSAVSGEYVRNSGELYDLIVYQTNNITNASQYVQKEKKFYIDIYTTAPVGTEIILQLETDNATASNFPAGRHSRYGATIKENNNWQRLEFNLLDRPDASAADTGITSMILLFNSNSYTGDTYYYDNLDSYNVETGNTSNLAPTISITDPADGSSFESGTTISINANATDADGTVAQVEFFANNISIGTDSSAPFNMSWQVAGGTTNLTAKATDNANLSTTSSAIAVTGTGNATATSMHVNAISTGTASAGKGTKYGTASVTIVDDLGRNVEGANVEISFSGSFSEQAMAITNAQGIASFQTQGSSKGTLSVNICVDNVTHVSLDYNNTANVVTCSSASATQKSASKNSNVESSNEDKTLKLLLSPNPTRNIIQFSMKEMEMVSDLSIFDMSGRMLYSTKVNADTGAIDMSQFPKGVYIIKIRYGNGQIKTDRVVKK